MFLLSKSVFGTSILVTPPPRLFMYVGKKQEIENYHSDDQELRWNISNLSISSISFISGCPTLMTQNL